MPTLNTRSILLRHKWGSRGRGIPQEFWIEAPVGEAWTVLYRLVQQEGAPVVAEIRLYPYEDAEGRVPHVPPGEWSHDPSIVPRGGLTTRVWRRVRLGSDVKEGLNAFRRYLRIVRPVRQRVREAGFRRLKRPRVGHSKWSDEKLLDAAVFYARRGGRRPVADLAEAWRLKRSQARDMLQAAKDKGYLTKGSLGVTSRTLTEKALAALEARERTS